jgi:hypothetical protein
MDAHQPADERRVAADLVRIVGPDERLVDLDHRRHAGQGAKTLDDVANGHGLAGSNVDDREAIGNLARREGLQQQAIGHDNVADVRQVSPHLYVAGRDRAGLTPLHGHDPLGHRRHDKDRSLTSSRVVEGSGDDDWEAVASGCFSGHALLGHLG